MPEFHALMVFDPEVRKYREKLVELLKKLNSICESVSDPEAKKKCRDAVVNAAAVPMVITDIVTAADEDTVGARIAKAVKWVADLASQLFQLKHIPGVADIADQIIDAIAEYSKVYIDKVMWSFSAKIAKSSNRYLIGIPSQHKYIAEQLHGKRVYVFLTPYE